MLSGCNIQVLLYVYLTDGLLFAGGCRRVSTMLGNHSATFDVCLRKIPGLFVFPTLADTLLCFCLLKASDLLFVHRDGTLESCMMPLEHWQMQLEGNLIR